MTRLLACCVVFLSLASQAQAQFTAQPTDLRLFGGVVVSGTNPIPFCISDGTACITNFGTVPEFNLNTTGTSLVPGYAIALEGAGGPVAVDTEHPLPVTWTSGTTVTAQGIDVCSGTRAVFVIDIATAGVTEITPALAGASTRYYVCSLLLVTDAENDVALVDDDTDGCGSATAGLAGGFSSAAEGLNFGAKGGVVLPATGYWHLRTQTQNSVICILTSQNVQLSGAMTVATGP